MPPQEEKALRDEEYTRVYDGIPPWRELEAMSDIDLARLHASFSSEKPGIIVVQNEWRRREKNEQHKLNLELSKKQEIFSYKIAIIGVLAAIIGAICGALLQPSLKEREVVDLIRREIKTSQSAIYSPGSALQVRGKKDGAIGNNEKAKEVSSQHP